MPRRSHQFGMCITNLETRKSTISEVSDDGTTSQSIVDLATLLALGACATNHSWSEGHCDQGTGVGRQRYRSHPIPICYLRYIEPIHRKTRSGSSPILEFALLGLLKEQDLHGYELRRRLGQILGPIGRLSFGTLYPALNRLESSGAVTVLKISESRTGLTTARGRKVYGITKVGQALFDELLDSHGKNEDDRSFALRLAFAQYLPREARLRLLSRRREQLADQLIESREALAARQDRLDNYSRSLMEHQTEAIEHDITWLDRLITSEQKPSLDSQHQ